MPQTYELTDKTTGQTFDLEWRRDTPPTEQDIAGILSQHRTSSPPADSGHDPHTVTGGLKNLATDTGSLLTEAPMAVGRAVLRGYSKLLSDPRGAISDTVAGAKTLPGRALSALQAAPGAIAEHLQQYSPAATTASSGEPSSNLRETLYHHPAGALMDASVAMRGVGLIPGLERAGAIGAAMDPVAAAAHGTGAVLRGVRAMGQPVATRIGMAAYSPAADVLRAEDRAPIQQLLTEHRLPTSGGLKRTQGELNTLGTDRRMAIQSRTNQGLEMPLDVPVNAADLAIKRQIQGLHPTSVLDNAKAFTTELSGRQPYAQTGMVPFEDSQKMKGVMQEYASYDPAKREVGSELMNKSAAGGIKDWTAQHAPDVDAINSRLSDLIPMRNIQEKALELGQKSAFRFGLGGAIGGGAGAFIGAPQLGAAVGAALGTRPGQAVAAMGINDASRVAGAAGRALGQTGAIPGVVTEGMRLSDAEARRRGQIVTQTVKSVMADPQAQSLSVSQQMQLIDRVVDASASVPGGIPDVTRQKARATSVIKGLKARQTTERP